MTQVEWHLLYLGLEVAGLLVILFSMDGLIHLLRLIVSRWQRKRDHREFVAKFRGTQDEHRDADQIVIEARRGKV